MEKNNGLLNNNLREKIKNCHDDKKLHKLLKLADSELDDDVLDLVTGGTGYENCGEEIAKEINKPYGVP